MKNILLATAGHIDHGKTALITALNGFCGDSTDEEKRRGITIDLSFSHLLLGDKNIAFIDVPGHENLLKTMISGAIGADFALLIVASNEGLKAQSFEHIKILNLLNISNIILCITKCDLTSDEQIKATKNECIKELEKNENLKLLECFELSIKNAQSIEKLKNFLANLEAKEKQLFCLPKYHIDRLFSLKGVGLVATGSLHGNEIKVGEKLFDYDANAEISVRSLQVHDKSVDTAQNAQRVAINISSPNAQKIKKGDFISKKGYFRAFKEIDAIFYGQITHGANVVLCIGTKSLNAKVCVLCSQNAENSFISLKLEKPLFACFDESFILLENSRLIGGGRILNPVSEPMKKKEKIKLLNAVLKHDFLSAFELLKTTHETGFGLICAPQRFGMSGEQALQIAKKVKNAIIDEKNFNVYDIKALDLIKNFIKFMLSKNELAVFSATSIALKLNWASENIIEQAILQLEKILDFQNGLYFKKGADFSKLKIRLEDEIFKEIERGGLTPLAPYNIYDIFEVDRKLGDDALKKLCAASKVCRLEHNLFVSTKNLAKAKDLLKALIKRDGYADITNAKAALNLSRKYLIAYLQALDGEKDIIKIENKRMFKS